MNMTTNRPQNDGKIKPKIKKAFRVYIPACVGVEGGAKPPRESLRKPSQGPWNLPGSLPDGVKNFDVFWLDFAKPAL